jgi:hypothetical protein
VWRGSARFGRVPDAALHKRFLRWLYSDCRNIARFATFADLPLRQMRCATRKHER